MTILSHRDWEFDDPLVLVGFPSQGLVGAIVASYLVPKLDMELVATMDSRHFPPVSSVRDGQALAPVQIFASTTRCGLDGSCDQLVVIRSDAAPPPEHTDEISSELLAYSDEIGAESVVTLEGAPTSNGLDDVFTVPNLHAEIDPEALGAKPFPDGSISGFSASLLVEGNTHGSSVICLFTGVHEEMPDAEAAARLVDIADELVPGIKMDPEPLMERAKGYEEELKAALKEQERAAGGGESERSIMYS